MSKPFKAAGTLLAPGWTPPASHYTAPPPIHLSLGLPSRPSRTPVNKATQEQRSPSVPLKSGDYMTRVHVCVSMACGEVCIYACMHGPCVCVDVAYLDQPIHTHTWSQLAVNEVPDRHSAAATLQTAAVNPDTEADQRTPESRLYRTRTFCLLKKTSAGIQAPMRRQWGRFFYYLAYPELPQLIHHSRH